MPKAAKFSQPARHYKITKTPEKPKGLALSEPADVTLRSKSRKPGHAPEKIPHWQHIDPNGDHIAFIRSASAMELRLRYGAEATTHRNMKSRRSKGAIIDPDFEEFRSFLLHVGPMPGKGMTLDRINNDDPEYGRGKVAWADRHIQNNNKSDTLTFRCSRTGEVYTTSRLAKLQKVSPDAIRKRRRQGWSDDQIIDGEGPKSVQKTQLSKSPGYIPAPIENATKSFPQTSNNEKKTLWAVGNIWQQQVSANCKNTELIPDWRTLSYARNVVSQIGFEKTCDLIQAVASAWISFIGYVREHDGIRQVPDHPSFEFVFRHHLQAALDFTLDEAAQAERDMNRRQQEFIREYRRQHGEHASVPLSEFYRQVREEARSKKALKEALKDKM